MKAKGETDRQARTDRQEKETTDASNLGHRGQKLCKRLNGRMYSGGEQTDRLAVVVGCSLYVPATCWCISGTDVLIPLHVLPH